MFAGFGFYFLFLCRAVVYMIDFPTCQMTDVLLRKKQSKYLELILLEKEPRLKTEISSAIKSITSEKIKVDTFA